MIGERDGLRLDMNSGKRGLQHCADGKTLVKVQKALRSRGEFHWHISVGESVSTGWLRGAAA
jgi:hypothetical protein